MNIDTKDTNDTAVKGVIFLGGIAIVAGAVLSGLDKDTAVITIFVVIGSNVVSGILGYLTGKEHSKPTVAGIPVTPTDTAPKSEPE